MNDTADPWAELDAVHEQARFRGERQTEHSGKLMRFWGDGALRPAEPLSEAEQRANNYNRKRNEYFGWLSEVTEDDQSWLN